MAGFTNEEIKAAQDSQSKYGVPASVSLAQMALESGWGTSTLATKFNNFFGIKAASRNQRAVVNGTAWSRYNSMEDSFNDHGYLLSQNLYASKTNGSKNVEQYVNAIAETYAPASDGNSNYADSVLQLIKSYNLTQYDGDIWSSGTHSTGGGFTKTPVTVNSGSMKKSLFSNILKAVSIGGIAILAVVFFLNAFQIPTKSGAKNG